MSKRDALTYVSMLNDNITKIDWAPSDDDKIIIIYKWVIDGKNWRETDSIELNAEQSTKFYEDYMNLEDDKEREILMFKWWNTIIGG